MAMLAPDCETDDCAVATTAAPPSFRRLLEWLGDGNDSDTGRYAEMRRRLVAYFDRRNRLDAEALADETFGRIGCALEGRTLIETLPPARCCYVMATRVLNEAIARDERLVRTGGTPAVAAGQPADRIESGERLPQSVYGCGDVDRGLRELPADGRQLLIEYYRDPRRTDSDHRRRMAERMHVAPTTLGVRAFQIRDAVMTAARDYFSRP